MKKCMETDKPLISIVLALYKPNENWLIKLLKSLNNQTYSNIELIAWDDCPEFPTNLNLFDKYIDNFEYKVYAGDYNMGSNKVFQKLTTLANGDYIAYCDQDDIWHENKINKMLYEIKDKNAVFACSELEIIDSDDNLIYNSYTSYAKRHTFPTDDNNISKILLVTNFAVGCTIMIDSKIAKKAVPFVKSFYHDHWLALFASLNGNIVIIRTPLIKYRIHGNNQTGLFIGINTKDDYFEKRIRVFYERNMELYLRINKYPEIKNDIENIKNWAKARYDFYRKFNFKDLKTIVRFYKYGKSVAFFEIMLPIMPKFLFNILIKLLKNGKI